jgi:hypothetical protein
MSDTACQYYNALSAVQSNLEHCLTLTFRRPQIVTALTTSIPSVCYAFIIHLTLTCMYAILATHIYGPVNEELFGTFSDALFTVRARPPPGEFILIHTCQSMPV